jgi:hypothetical protein
MTLVIPLWSGVFSLLTSGFTADHIDKRHGQMEEHVTAAVRGAE